LVGLPDFFQHLVGLKRLNLSDNQLIDFPIGPLQLRKLEQLDLSGNQLTRLPKDFGRLRQLQDFQLRNNQLKRLPTTFSDLSQLRRLELNGNRLKELPEEFGKLVQLQVLDLSKNRFEQFPLPILTCQQLEQLRLSGNKLLHLPAEIGTLRQLQRLDVSKNKLAELPASIGQLRALRRLNLSTNALEALPESLANCRLLVRLNLARNAVQHLPVCLAQLSQLERLDLSHNQLLDGRLDLSRLTYLKELSLQHNQLDQVPAWLAALTGLKRLDLRKNPIPTDDPGWLQLPPVQLPGLSLNRLLKPFLAACHREAVPPQWRPALFDSYCKRPVEGPFDPAFLETALNFPLGIVRDWACSYVQERHFQAFQGQFGIGDHLVVLGKVALPLGLARQVFQQAEVKVSKQWSPKATHVVIGAMPGKALEVLKRKELIGLDADALRQWIQSQSEGFLWRSAPETALKKLEGLLLSDQSANLELAIQLLQGNGIPQATLNPLYVAYRKAEQAAQKRALRALLQLGARPGDEAFLQKKIPLNNPEALQRSLKELEVRSSFDPAYLLKHLTRP
ncbi:MAG: leucine-rich repeat domain-containing protein, partial [Phaeodactylibacter sp.]|nr:leucine-rich repeat domain-containing protein [Phaeodactylibacter sp.]